MSSLARTSINVTYKHFALVRMSPLGMGPEDIQRGKKKKNAPDIGPSLKQWGFISYCLRKFSHCPIQNFLKTVPGGVKVSSKWSATSQNFLKYAYFIVKVMPIWYSTPKQIHVCFSTGLKEWFAPNVCLALSLQEDAPCLWVGWGLRNTGLKPLVCPLPGFQS